MRKAEYVRDLASRFADRRLSTEKLIHANDDELAQMLIEIKGIGRWTVDMFAIFSLRRPNILPVGDLGVQRGLVRWFLSLHSPSHTFAISPEKIGGQSDGKKLKNNAKVSTIEDNDELPTFGPRATSSSNVPASGPTNPPASSVQPTDCVNDGEAAESEIAPMPPPFTPSIKHTLNRPAAEPGSSTIPLPDGLSVSVLKSRLDGKKIKGAFLTPKEMEDLTECWKPFRSLGIYYMWSVAKVAE